MPAPNADTPIPDGARAVVETAHRRYHAMSLTERPPLNDPTAGLLTRDEVSVLHRFGYYPLPPAVVLHGCTADEYRQRQLAAYVRKQLDIERVALAAQLPDAIMATLEGIQV